MEAAGQEIPNDPAWPSMRDELNRKTVEAVERLLQRWSNAEITNGQFVTGMQAIFATVAGIVDEDVMAIITTASSYVRDVPERSVRFYVKGAALILNQHTAGSGDVLVRRYDVVKAHPLVTNENETALDAKNKLKAVGDTLVAMGFIEL